MARPELKNFRRIVVKVGSLAPDRCGGRLREAGVVARLPGRRRRAAACPRGASSLVVSSGAIALGRYRAQAAARPRSR